MARPKFRGALLCEDREQRDFFRKLLERKWFGKGRVRIHVSLNEGAGDAFVVARYAREVQLARQWRSENYALVVAIDGDRKKMQNRMLQLDRQLEKSGFDQRGKDEMIVICVPTRNIETWELWLCGDLSVDEGRDYKHRFEEAKRRGEVSTMAAVKSWFSCSFERGSSDGERNPTFTYSRAPGTSTA